MRHAILPAVLLTIAVPAWAGSAATAPQIQAPPGFEVRVFDDSVGAGARHLVVRDNGDVLIARQDGVLVGLEDSNGDGRADRTERRDLAIATGLAIHAGFLYFSNATTVSRVPLDDSLVPRGKVQTVVSGFPEQGDHQAKSLAFDPQGRLYVNVGAPSNACQKKARTPGSPGLDPCPQLQQHAGIWRFPEDAVGLDQANGERFVTGTRNVVAMAYDHASGALYFTMHGRDQLHSLWPDLFGVKDNAEMPAEEFHRAVAGGDYGWPYTFYDGVRGRRLIAPEYGGDGGKEADSGKYVKPLYAFPAHWAPDDMLFYRATSFPERYRGGVFIAWHGSWNRAPLPQQGYRVTFLPFADGKPAGKSEDFLTGFKTRSGDPGRADYRPVGLGVGPDGALYVTESSQGRVWRVAYSG